eukprot:scaffold100012_cov21-Tisochrysis_lutea.AAC.1
MSVELAGRQGCEHVERLHGKPTGENPRLSIAARTGSFTTGDVRVAEVALRPRTPLVCSVAWHSALKSSSRSASSCLAPLGEVACPLWPCRFPPVAAVMRWCTSRNTPGGAWGCEGSNLRREDSKMTSTLMMRICTFECVEQ